MPTVTDEDLERLRVRLRELLQRTPDLSLRVARMGDAYERAMRELLG